MYLSSYIFFGWFFWRPKSTGLNFFKKRAPVCQGSSMSSCDEVHQWVLVLTSSLNNLGILDRSRREQHKVSLSWKGNNLYQNGHAWNGAPGPAKVACYSNHMTRNDGGLQIPDETKLAGQDMKSERDETSWLCNPPYRRRVYSGFPVLIPIWIWS
jgi:hypothetical protein